MMDELDELVEEMQRPRKEVIQMRRRDFREALQKAYDLGMGYSSQIKKAQAKPQKNNANVKSLGTQWQEIKLAILKFYHIVPKDEKQPEQKKAPQAQGPDRLDL